MSLVLFAAGPAAAQVAPSAFVNFEGAQTNPIRISSDGTRLFAVNTPNATVSVFDLTKPSSPGLIAEIPVGIEPVSVNINPGVPGNDEAWVVNQESNSISVVSVSKGIVTDTLYAKSEPADVVFAAGQAFVSVARSNCVNVYSATTHALVKSIPLTGENPRAMAVNADGSKVYAAFALSGNHTTIVSEKKAPPPPPPVNPALPPPPQVSLIVDAYDTTWSTIIDYTMPDNDLAEISTSKLRVTTYYPHLGTVNLGLAVNPASGNLYVANTDALNLTMFETALNGHIVNHRISMVSPGNPQSPTSYDLNPGINYTQLPNPAALATALAMPTAIVFEPTGRYLYIAAFGTDRIGIFDTTTNTVSSFIEIDPQATGAAVNPSTKRGPRGLALNVSSNLLYVLNRIYNTISIVNLSSNTVTGEIPTGTVDPTPAVIRDGRGFLYDHKLSGNGTGACASCHVDGELDLLAWNLGDPTGSMTSLLQGNETILFHPMKGPMTTQTMRGLLNTEPYHWRGDKPDLAAFNGAFSGLLGGTQLSAADMAAFTNFVNTIVYLPNPNQNLDRSMPSTLTLPDFGTPGDPNTGLSDFFTIIVNSHNQTCSGCHPANPGTGTDGLIDPANTNSPQPFKHSQLRNMYQKTNANFKTGAVSVDGFGFLHDGSAKGLFSFLGEREFPGINTNDTVKADIEAYMLCFDTGTPPAVGYARTLTAATVNTSAAQTDWNTLERQASLSNIDLIANGTVSGKIQGLLYQPAGGTYQVISGGSGSYTRAQLTTLILGTDILTIMGVPTGSGSRMAANRTRLAAKRVQAAKRP